MAFLLPATAAERLNHFDERWGKGDVYIYGP
jgi:hypothetical protein